MGKYVSAYHISEGLGYSRKTRASGEYRYYVPSLLSDFDVRLGQDELNMLSKAESDLERFASSQVGGLEATEGLSRLLLRAEAVCSSHIEGLTIGTRRLLRAEFLEGNPGAVRFDQSAADVLGNVNAMRTAVEAASSAEISVETLKDIHRSLLAGTRLSEIGGVVRTKQNWVGGNRFNPLQATYVPPAPELVDDLLEDLVEFCNRDDLPAILQAAIAHMQFESIHPFMDGNGRTGRALIQTLLMRRLDGLSCCPPISLMLATHAREYERCLQAMHFEGDWLDGAEATREWSSFFSWCCSSACAQASDYSEQLAQMRDGWVERLGFPRADSAVAQMTTAMQGAPVFTIASMATEIGKSVEAVRVATDRLVDAGIVVKTSKGKRDVVYEAPEVISSFNLYERRLASPSAGDMPARPVPEEIRSTTKLGKAIVEATCSGDHRQENGLMQAQPPIGAESPPEWHLRR